MFVFFIDAAATVIVADAVAGHRVDEARKCLGSNEVTTAQQAQEDVLHHVLGIVVMKIAHRNEMHDFIAVLRVIVRYKLVIIHLRVHSFTTFWIVPSSL